MTQLLEIKDKIVRLYSKYDTYFFILIKFAVAFAMLWSINANIGYMQKISSLPVALVLSLVCSILPTNMMIWVAALVILLDLYALALEAALVGFVLFALVYFVYFRFSPKNGIGAVLTPVCFNLNIPYVMPVATGLLRPIYSMASVICGTVIFYFLAGVHQNASVLVGTIADENGEETSKLNVIIGQLLGNREMILVIAVFLITGILVYGIRRMAIEHAWTIAIAAGTIFQTVGLIIGFQMLNISGKAFSLLLGNIISMLLCFVIQFFFMDLDYARTERVQFEDDDYCYYVVAVPKKMIASREKKVQHFGNTSVMGKKIERKNTESASADSGISRKDIAEELDIDEELLK